MNKHTLIAAAIGLAIGYYLSNYIAKYSPVAALAAVS